VPSTLGSARSSSGLVAALASLLFLFPLVVWYRYSARIASAGGLYAFVEDAAGLTVARIQGTFWIVSYALYLVYTGPYIIYYLLPIVFPGITPYQPALVVALALLFAASLLGTLTVTLSIVAVMAVAQVLVTVALAAVSLTHLGAPAASFTGHGDFGAVLQGTGNVSLLYICASLPLFLGGEVRGGSRAVQRGLVWAFAGTAVLAFIASIPIANASRAIADAPIPGVALASAFAGPGFATLVGVGVAVSVAGLVIAEFIALSQLLSTIFKQPSERMVRAIAVGIVVASVISLVNPKGIYPLLLRPSLIALWISQLLVVAVYPRFAARDRRLRVGDLGLAGAASALMAFGLYTAVVNPPVS
jgi:amino acid transporter